MLLERMGETVTHEAADGTMTEVPHALFYDADASDQTVMDVQTRFINQARYKGDQKTLTILWPKSAPHDLMDTFVWVRGERYRVYANPTPPSYTPNGYDLFVTATASLFLFELELLEPTSTQDDWGVWHSTYEGTTTMANLLRLSDDVLQEARQPGLSSVTLFELQPDVWDPKYTMFEFNGDRYAINSIDYAADVVVIGGVREVTDE